MINKNSIPDIKVISMSYLDFLFYKSEKEKDIKKDIDIIAKLCTILSIIFQNEEDKINGKDIKIEYTKDENGKYGLLIDGKEVTSADFEIIKDIICIQNGIELPDESIHPDVQKALDEAQKFYNETHNSGKVGSLEDQMICVSISTPYKFEDIYKLTIRKFTKILQRVDTKLHYKIYMTAIMSGTASFKKPIEHWTNDLSKTFEERYANVMVDAENFSNKVNMKDLGKKD